MKTIFHTLLKVVEFKIPFLLLLLRPHVLGKEKAVQEFLLGETILQESGAARYLHIAQTKT